MDILGLTTITRALERLHQDDLSTTQVVDSKGRLNPNTKIVNESSLYDLALESRKPEAKSLDAGSLLKYYQALERREGMNF